MEENKEKEEKLIECPKCENKFYITEKSCPVCNYPTTKMLNKKNVHCECGQRLEPNWKYCANCGRNIEKIENSNKSSENISNTSFVIIIYIISIISFIFIMAYRFASSISK